MGMYPYTKRSADLLEEHRAEIREEEGRPPETQEEKDRLWELVVGSARAQ